MADSRRTTGLSQDAAIALAIAGTSVPHAASVEAEAERWLRVMRLHGEAGCTLQALGVGEAPLASPAEPRAVRLLKARPLGEDIVEMVSDRASSFASERGARLVSSVDILFALLEIYGEDLDRALYVRGTSREELLECLAARAGRRAETRV